MAIKIGRKYISAEFIRDLPVIKDMLYKDINIIISIINLAATYGKDITK